jgi:large subunit ribosomal protein L21
MYAIMMASGKQFRVEPGTVLDLDRMDVEPGTVVTCKDQVLFVHDDKGITVGTPTVPGVTVELEVVGHLRGDKIVVFKMKRRKRYRRTQGHRQELTRVKVKGISVAA